MPAITPPPQTTTVTNHGLLIYVGNTAIGAINEWTPNMSRTVTPVYEFGAVTSTAAGIAAGPGEAFEMVPGNISNTSIRVARYDIYTAPFESVFKTGTADLTMLSLQDRAFEVREVIYKPTSSGDTETIFTQYKYTGCWFSELGRTHSAQSDRIVKVNATLNFVRRVVDG